MMQTELLYTLLAALLGIATGILVVLSLIEKPIWPMMWAPRTPEISDQSARKVHVILKRVIHLLPPTMMKTMGAASLAMIALLVVTDFRGASLAVAALFFTQLALIVARLLRDIRGVDDVPSDGDPAQVCDGLAALPLLHHRGLLMAASTLIALLALQIALT